MSTCPMKVIPASAESATVQPYQLGKMERLVSRYGGRVDRNGDGNEEWEWEGYIYQHPDLADAEHMFAYVSKWDCLCALMEALGKRLYDEGFVILPKVGP